MAFAVEKKDLSVSVAALVDGYRKFSSRFYQAVAQNIEGNIITSPLSIHILLSYLFHGSDGFTTEEITVGLNLSKPEHLHEAYKDILSVLNSVESIELILSNRLFYQHGLRFLEQFESIGRDYYNVSLKNVDFHDKDASITITNSWISDNTNQKINNILSSDDINENTILILVNAIYFKGHWENEFEVAATEKRLFHVTSTLNKQVPTMYKESKFVHGEIPKLHSRFIEIPYTDPNLDMIIILPNEIEGLKDLEENFDWNVVVNAEKSKGQTRLYLPKFKVESTLDLKKVLCKIGFNTMFENNANFSKMSSNALKVDKVIQKGFLEVNEFGSEAAAATVVTMMLESACSYFQSPDEFIVDRPFIAVIRHAMYNIPIFISSVCDIMVEAAEK